jgi:hypothetical protein
VCGACVGAVCQGDGAGEGAGAAGPAWLRAAAEGAGHRLRAAVRRAEGLHRPHAACGGVKGAAAFVAAIARTGVATEAPATVVRAAVGVRAGHAAGWAGGVLVIWTAGPGRHCRRHGEDYPGLHGAPKWVVHGASWDIDMLSFRQTRDLQAACLIIE